MKSNQHVFISDPCKMNDIFHSLRIKYFTAITGKMLIVVSLVAALFFAPFSMSMAGRIVINGTSGSAYMVLGGSVYLVIDTIETAAITRLTGTGNSFIIAENESNIVKWNMRTNTGTYTFPLGRCTGVNCATPIYVPFVFNKTTAGTESGTGYVTARTWYTSNNAVWPSGTSLCGTIQDSVVDRFWTIDVTNYTANTVTATVDFYYNATEINSIAEASLVAQHWSTDVPGACKWETPYTGTVNTTDNYVRVTSSSFSPWTLVSRYSPLPIELLSFNGECVKQIPTLSWETATEVNNSYFTIERSADGQVFEPIGTKQGAGNSGTTLYYDIADNNPVNGKAYYRLKQTDYDGKYSYSGTVVVPNCTEINTNDLSIFSGKNNDILLSVNSTSDKSYNVYIYDYTGRKIHNEILNVSKGSNTWELKSLKFSTGVYLVSLQNEDEIFTKKLFINK